MPNLIPLPSNAFSGGAVKLDNSPVDRFLIMSQNINARNQARNIAVTKYLGQMNAKVMAQGKGVDATKTNDKGELDPNGRSDKDDFMDAVQAWNDHTKVNRNKIANPLLDNGEAQSENEQLYNHAMDIAERSQQKVQNINKVGEMNQRMQEKGYTLPDAVIAHIGNSHRRVLDPNYEPIDLNSVTYNPKTWSALDEGRFSNEVSKIPAIPQTPVVGPADPNTGMQTVTTTKKLDQNGLMKTFITGSKYYNNDASFKQMIDGMINHPTEESHRIADLYKEAYGENPTTGEQFAAGYALAGNNSAKTEIKSQPVSANSQMAQSNKIAVAKAGAGIHLSTAETLHDYDVNHPATPVPGSQPDSDGYLQNLESKAPRDKMYSTVVDGKQVNGFQIEKDPKVASIFAAAAPKKINPDRITVDPKTGDYIGTWYQKDENGVPQGSGGNFAISKSLPPIRLSRETVKQGLNESLMTKKQAGSALPKQSQPAGKTRPPLESFIRK